MATLICKLIMMCFCIYFALIVIEMLIVTITEARVKRILRKRCEHFEVVVDAVSMFRYNINVYCTRTEVQQLFTSVREVKDDYSACMMCTKKDE